jgi:hypothetical protein
MKTTISILLLTLFGASLVTADQSTLRYKLAGELRLQMEQDIYPSGLSEPLAGRRFEMSFDISEEPDGDQLIAELTAIKGNYEAHGMNQRLSVDHLTGQQLPLDNDGMLVKLTDRGRGLSLGLITDGDLHPIAVLVDVLPELPTGPVHPGLSWKSVQPIQSLEGWAWAEGNMHFLHEVTSVSNQAGNTIVTIRSQGETAVSAAEGTSGYQGEGVLERQIDWAFNLSTGQMVCRRTPDHPN